MTSNEEQLQFINHPLCDMCLLGIPGGGKTKTIIDKIYHMKNNKEILNGSEFLLSTFSRKARLDFLDKGKLKCKKTFKNDNIRTVHSIAGLILKNVFGKTCSNINTLIAGVNHLLNTTENINLDKVGCLKKCKCIFVDEGQDVSNIQYELIKNISSILNIPVIMIGDPDQNIYQFQGGSDKYLMNHSDDKIILDKNYRSTKNIIRFANQFRPWKNTKPIISARGVSGSLPNIYCDNLNNLKKYLLNEIENTDIKLEEIAIIGPVKKGNFDIHGHHKNLGLQIVAGILDDNYIKYISHYKFSENDTIKSNREDKIKEGHINLLTIHGSKGLEFKKVILLNFHLATMGRIPTQEKYNEYKYLWYVGITRAKDELSIFIEEDKPAWTELNNIDESFYNLIGNTPKYNNNLAKDEIKPDIYSVTNMLEDLSEEQEYELETMLNVEISKIKLYENPNTDIIEFTDYSALYGSFIENIFTYYSGGKSLLISSFLKKNNSYILIPNKYYKIYKRLKTLIKPLTLHNLKNNKNIIKDTEIEFYNYICSKCKYDNIQLTLIKDNGVSIIDENIVKRLCESIEDNIVNKIFELTKYFYQLEYECKSILKKDFSDHIESLIPYVKEVINLAKNTNDITEYQGIIKHPHLPIIGIYDAITNDSIIDFKFSKSYNYKQALQLILYYNLMYPYWDKEINLEIWNLYLGEKYTVKICDNIDNYKLNIFLCETFDIKMKDMIYIYDLETTGLEDTCEIIERYFIDYNFRKMVSEGIIKPKLPLSPYIKSLTGITDTMVINGDKDINNFKNEINNILKYTDKPIFIAHNGDRFDHRILINKGILYEDNCIFMDSKQIISASNENKTYTKTLYEIYKLITNKTKNNIHRAKTDTEMIIEIFDEMNINPLNYICIDR